MERLKINDSCSCRGRIPISSEGFGRFALSAVEGLQNLQRFMKAYNPRVGEVRLTDLVDDSVIRSLAESGFVDKTFRSYGIK